MNMREKIALAAFVAQYGYEPSDDAFEGPMHPRSKSGQALAIADAVLDALTEPTQGMQKAGWCVIGKQDEASGDVIDIGPVFAAMIQAAKDGQ